jgi:hypothetical protein
MPQGVSPLAGSTADQRVAKPAPSTGGDAPTASFAAVAGKAASDSLAPTGVGPLPPEYPKESVWVPPPTTPGMAAAAPALPVYDSKVPAAPGESYDTLYETRWGPMTRYRAEYWSSYYGVPAEPDWAQDDQ